ncbi:MAG: serine/threonine protein kinase [Deltaproteobacteria bacterium]|nr:serine/threonine protein kinase [Deltaproteobacteria bacterium]
MTATPAVRRNTTPQPKPGDPSGAPAGLQQVAHYQIRETLGFGALGTVYLAWDTKLNRSVAVKVLADDVKDANLRQRFHLEARAIAALKHPNIVSVLDFSDQDAPLQFIALERLEGRSIFDFLCTYGPLPEQVALCVAREVAAALEYAHSQNVVHRDIKPDNVVLEGERVVIIDFGAMRLTDNHQWIPETDVDKAPMAVGTPGFMAPEQLVRTEVDHRADLFAVGALLFNACTGRRPYEATSTSAEEIHAEARRGRYRDPRDFQPLLTPGFCDLVGACLAVKPGDRPNSAAALREHIEALLRQHGITDVKPVLQQYVRAPSLDLAYDLRTIDTLTNELKLALVRDLQRAIRDQNAERVTQATRQLRRVEHYFAANDKSRSARAERPRYLINRPVRRLRWFVLGIAAALAVVTVLLFSRPAVFGHLHDALVRLAARWG